MKRGSLDSVTRVVFDRFEGNGCLTVFPAAPEGVPFQIARMFSVAGVRVGTNRGNHAHRDCTQLLVCAAGSVNVTLRDGLQQKDEAVAGAHGLLIPPLVWNSVRFEEPGTVLLVFCDEPFDESDYLRDWDEYVALQALDRA